MLYWPLDQPPPHRFPREEQGGRITEAEWAHRCRNIIRYIPVGEGRYAAELGNDPVAAAEATERRTRCMGDRLRRRGMRLRTLRADSQWPKPSPQLQPAPPQPPPPLQVPVIVRALAGQTVCIPPPQPAVCCPACGHWFPVPVAAQPNYYYY